MVIEYTSGKTTPGNNAQNQDISNDRTTDNLEQYLMVSTSRQETQKSKFRTSRHLDELLHDSRSKNAERKKFPEKDILSEATNLLNELLMDSPTPTSSKTNNDNENEEENKKEKKKLSIVTTSLKVSLSSTLNRKKKSEEIMKNEQESRSSNSSVRSSISEIDEDAKRESEDGLNETGYDTLSQTDDSEEEEMDEQIQNKEEEEQESENESETGKVEGNSKERDMEIIEEEEEEADEYEDDEELFTETTLDELLNEITNTSLKEPRSGLGSEIRPTSTKDNTNKTDGNSSMDAVDIPRSSSPQLAPSPVPLFDRLPVSGLIIKREKVEMPVENKFGQNVLNFRECVTQISRFPRSLPFGEP